MLNSDICEAIAVRGFEDVIYGEWKHEGFIRETSGHHINFELDGKEYVFVLHEIEDGHNFSEYL